VRAGNPEDCDFSEGEYANLFGRLPWLESEASGHYGRSNNFGGTGTREAADSGINAFL
jgi:hypothetical protein